MKSEPLLDLPDDEYRSHWLAFHEQTDWAAHRDMTAVPITFVGPDALYRRNKGSFLDRMQQSVHCRPYAGHARRARRTGAWIPEEKVFELALYPGHQFAPQPAREKKASAPHNPASRWFNFGAWFQHAPVR